MITGTSCEAKLASRAKDGDDRQGFSEALRSLNSKVAVTGSS
jgi:hypothetical protein